MYVNVFYKSTSATTITLQKHYNQKHKHYGINNTFITITRAMASTLTLLSLLPSSISMATQIKTTTSLTTTTTATTTKL
jgi:hypothetical protein